MSRRLSVPQVALLRVLARGPRGDITDEGVVKALARRGYAERFSERMAHLHSRHEWRITPAGQAVLDDIDQWACT